jgi:hypothetical protein
MPTDHKIQIDPISNGNFDYRYHPSGGAADPHQQTGADTVAWKIRGTPQGFTIGFGSLANCPFTWSSPTRHFDSHSWVANFPKPGVSGSHKYTVTLDSGWAHDPYIIIVSGAKKFLVEKVVPLALIAGGSALVAIGISLLNRNRMSNTNRAD